MQEEVEQGRGFRPITAIYSNEPGCFRRDEAARRSAGHVDCRTFTAGWLEWSLQVQPFASLSKYSESALTYRKWQATLEQAQNAASIGDRWSARFGGCCAFKLSSPRLRSNKDRLLNAFRCEGKLAKCCAIGYWWLMSQRKEKENKTQVKDRCFVPKKTIPTIANPLAPCWSVKRAFFKSWRAQHGWFRK